MSNGNIELITGPMFSGKCLGVDTPVLLYNGSVKNVQDITTNDILIGDDSKPRIVSSTTYGYGNLYKITQTNNGMTYVVNEHHIITLKNKYCRTDIIDISLKEYFEKPGFFIEKYKGFRVQPEFRYKCVDINSKYWDGSTDSIPQNIKYNSLKVREEWIVDHLENNGVYQSYQKNMFFVDILKWLPENIKDYTNLLKSVGLTYHIKDRELNIYGNFLHEFGWKKLKGKVVRYIEYNALENLSDIYIEYIGEGEFYGFTLNKNHRFLLEDGTVTHNTTELMRRLNRDVFAKRKILYINHVLDNRSDTIYSTHNPMLNFKETYQNIKMRSYSSLPSIKDIEEFDTIGVDEAQFFETLEMVEKYADKGKRVIVAGLSSDSNRKKFGYIPDLLPIAEECTILHAVCLKCAEDNINTDAAFTMKISDESANQIDVGATDKYIPVCRYHFNK